MSRRGIAVLLLLAVSIGVSWWVLRLRDRARLARSGADALANDLARLVEEAQVEALVGGTPALLSVELARAEPRFDAGEFAAARTEEIRVAVQLGAALREIGERPRALARLEHAERAALEHGRTTWEELLLDTSPPDPDSVLAAREELARTWLAQGDGVRALHVVPLAVDSNPRRLLLVGEILGDLGDEEGEEAFLREAILHSHAFVRFDALARLASRNDAIELRREALDALSPWVSESDPRVARRTYELASALDDRGPRTAEEALRLYARALDARLERSCGDSRELSTHLNNFGLLLKRNDRLAEAEPLLVRALEMRQRVVPGDDRGTATMMHNVGTLMRDSGEDQAAEAMLSAGLAMRYRLYPAGHPDVAQSLQSLAWFHQLRGEYARAVDLARTAVLILRRDSNAEDLDLAVAIDNLASALLDRGRHAEAERLTREALSIEERLISGDDPRVAQTLDNLGVILYRRRGDLVEAERRLAAALAMRRALFGDGHATVAETLKHLAWLHERAEDYPNAERRYREAIELRRSSAPDPGDLVRLQNDLADCLLASGDPGRAADVFREAVATAIANLPLLAEALAMAAEGLVVTANRSLRHADAEVVLVHAAEVVHADGELPSRERARVVEALCMLYFLWPKESPDAQRIRDQERAWETRLYAIGKR